MADVVRGRVISGVGEAALFVKLAWVTRGVENAVGFAPYPGTLNVRLEDAEALERWRAIREGNALRLDAPDGSCGGRLVPATLDRNVAAAIVVPDVTRYGEDVLEVLAPVHLRSHLGLRDGDPVAVTCP